MEKSNDTVLAISATTTTSDFKPLKFKGETILTAEQVRELYETIDDVEMTRFDLGLYIEGTRNRGTLPDDTRNRLADNLLRRWKRQGLVEFNGGRFGDASWRITL